MAVTCGFYNSKNGDRVYNADQMSTLFSGIIRDGILPYGHEEGTGNDVEVVTLPASQGGGTIEINSTDSFKVSPASSGLGVVVHRGRAWLNNTWTDNDGDLVLTLEAANPVQARIDAIVIEVNKSANTDASVTPPVPDRSNNVVVVRGSNSDNPQRPTLQNNPSGISQYALAYVTVRANATSIQASDIYYAVPEETPYVTGPLETISTAAVLQNWTNAFNQALNEFIASMNTTLNNAVEEYFGENGEARELFLPFQIHFSKHGQIYECDKTLSELQNAIDNGVEIEATYSDSNVASWSLYHLKLNRVYNETRVVNSDTSYTNTIYEFLYSRPPVRDENYTSILGDHDVSYGSTSLLVAPSESLKILYYYNRNPLSPGALISVSFGNYNDAFVVEFKGSSDDSTAQCNRTFDDIWDAYINGRPIIAQYVSPSGGICVQVLNDYKFSFIGGSTSGIDYDHVIGIAFFGSEYNYRPGGAGVPDYTRYCSINKSNAVSIRTESYYRINDPTKYARRFITIDGDNEVCDTSMASIASSFLGSPGTPIIFRLYYDEHIYSSSNFVIDKVNGVVSEIDVMFIIATDVPGDPFDVIRVEITSSGVNLQHYQQ